MAVVVTARARQGNQLCYGDAAPKKKPVFMDSYRPKVTLVRRLLRGGLMRVASFAMVMVISATPTAVALQEGEIPIVYGFLICDGPLEPGCKHFAASEFTSAVRVFRLFADRGDARAQNNLGVLFESGAGVHESKSEALRWYRQSAKAGLPLAQHNLAVLIAADYILGTAENPRNRSADFVEAYVLLSLAASQGLDIASRGRSDLVKYMSTDEIATANAELKKRALSTSSE